MTNMGKVQQLLPEDRKLLFWSFLLLPAIHVALLVIGYSRLRSAMENIIPLNEDKASVSRSEYVREAQRIARMVSVAARYGLYSATCLRRSLLVWWFLRHEGIVSQICFGVRRMDRQLDAHAWVEVQGIVVNDIVDIYEYYHSLEDLLPPKVKGS
jgi:hypothetical protein